MLVLGLDTATAVCALGVVDLASGKTLASRGNVVGPRHGERLLEEIDSVLACAGIELAELGALAVSAGPGSFTGLRVGLATAKGLALAGGLPLAGVPTLAALAAAAWQRFPEIVTAGTLVCACLDARRGEVTSQLWEILPGESAAFPLRPLVEEVRCSKPDTLGRELAELECPLLLVGDGAERYPELVVPGARLLGLSRCPPDGAVVAHLGARSLRANPAACTAGAVAPLYVQATDAERNLGQGRLGGRSPFAGGTRGTETH